MAFMEEWIYGGPYSAIPEVLPSPSNFILFYVLIVSLSMGKMTRKYHFSIQ
jgi:hypothetical protein